jgi:Domain of unknown function (DUF932)
VGTTHEKEVQIMFQGKRSLSELAAELERQAENKRDFKCPTSALQLYKQDDQLQLQVGDKGHYSPTALCHDQLGQYTGIPSKYYDKMLAESPALLAQNVNHWMRATKETRLVRVLDNKARAFLSNRYRTLDNSDVAEAALPVLVNEAKKLGGVKVISSEVTENRLYIKAVSERLTYEVKKGDVVQAGIVLSNSEVGLGSVRVEPILFRLVCLNGAVLEDLAVRKFHIGRQAAELEAAMEVYRDETRAADDRVFVMKLQDVVRASFDQARFDLLRDSVVDSTTRKIKAPIQDVVEEVATRYHLTDGHKDSFLKNLIEGGDLTAWGLANALTAVANTAENYEVATRLERVGGELMTMDGGKWRELAEAA